MKKRFYTPKINKTMENYTCLNGKPLNEKAKVEGKFYNVKTNREKQESKGYVGHDLAELIGEDEGGPYIIGTLEDIKDFLTKNGLADKVDETALEAKYETAVTTPKPKAKPRKKKEKEEKIPSVFSEVKNVFDDNDLDGVCSLNTAGSVIYNPATDDARDLPKHALLSLCDFRLAGLKGWAVITNVVDGDTVDLVKYIPLDELSKGHKFAKHSKTGVRSFVHGNGSFYAKLRCRFNGIDSMEHAHPEGQFAESITRELYRIRKGHVWVEFVEGANIETKEKYGRTLIKVYTDESKETELTDYLLKFNEEGDNGIKVAFSYNGSTKSAYAKSLEKRSATETKRVSEKLQTLFLRHQESMNLEDKLYTQGVKAYLRDENTAVADTSSDTSESEEEPPRKTSTRVSSSSLSKTVSGKKNKREKT